MRASRVPPWLTALAFHNYIIIKTTPHSNRPILCNSIMDNHTELQKRKRAETLRNQLAIESIPEGESTIIVDTSRHGKPSLQEDDSEESDIDQPDNEPLEKSTLYWSNQLVISRQDDDTISLRKPSAEHQLKHPSHLSCKIYIIRRYFLLTNYKLSYQRCIYVKYFANERQISQNTI